MQDGTTLTSATIDLAIKLWLGLSLPEDKDINPFGYFLMGHGVPVDIAIKLSEQCYENWNEGEKQNGMDGTHSRAA